MSHALLVAGRGEAAEATRSRFDAPELSAIRYADPAAWVTVAATANALEAQRSAVAAVLDRVAVVVTSAEGPVEAMAAMCEASRGGSSSPIRFPASNAGSLAGLTCIAFGFRGPSIVLALPASRGVPVGLLLAEAWLGRGVASFVVLGACGRPQRDRPAARCILLGGSAGTPLDRASDVAWLAASPVAPNGSSALPERR